MDRRIAFVKKYLPLPLYEEISRFDTVNEIRLRSGRISTVTANGKNVPLRYKTDKSSVEKIFTSMCRGSVYAQTENMTKGYIFLEEGIRVGVCGSAVTKRGIVENLSEIDSLCVRIPRPIFNAADELYKFFKTTGYRKSILIYSPPGVGKTTVLKDLVRQAGSGRNPLRIALIDERGELYDREMHGESTVDRYSFFPKRYAIENAVRTMSPQLIVCDEIGTEEEAEAILSMQNCGVPLIASAHGNSLNEIRKRPGIKKLFDASVFDAAALLKREGDRTEFYIEEAEYV